MTDALTEFFNVTNPAEHPARKDLVEMIMNKYSSTPRHLQVELGPSEVGTPCMRQLAYGLMDAPRQNPEWDPLPSIVGTAAHSWMDAAAAAANEKLGRIRWLHEHRVHVVPGLSGSCDLFDIDNRRVLDWKFPGATRMAMHRKEMDIKYRRQAHLYGRGFINAGFQVDEVAVVLMPRGGYLKDMYIWSEPYSDEIVADTLRRRDQTIALINDLRVEEFPERYGWFPQTKNNSCVFCPNFAGTPDASGFQCNGSS